MTQPSSIKSNVFHQPFWRGEWSLRLMIKWSGNTIYFEYVNFPGQVLKYQLIDAYFFSCFLDLYPRYLLTYLQLTSGAQGLVREREREWVVQSYQWTSINDYGTEPFVVLFLHINHELHWVSSVHYLWAILKISSTKWLQENKCPCSQEVKQNDPINYVSACLGWFCSRS